MWSRLGEHRRSGWATTTFALLLVVLIVFRDDANIIMLRQVARGSSASRAVQAQQHGQDAQHMTHEAGASTAPPASACGTCDACDLTFPSTPPPQPHPLPTPAASSPPPNASGTPGPGPMPPHNRHLLTLSPPQQRHPAEPAIVIPTATGPFGRTGRTAFDPLPAASRLQASLPHCPRCSGCTARLKNLRGDKASRGAAGEQIFYANYTTSGSPAVKRAVVKIWCIPQQPTESPAAAGPQQTEGQQEGQQQGQVQGQQQSQPQQQQQQEQQEQQQAQAHAEGPSEQCEYAEHAQRVVEHLLAQQRVVRDCGLGDVSVKTWAAAVNAVEPGSRQLVWWQGLWMDVAPGVSGESLLRAWPPAWGQGQGRAHEVARLMNERLNGTQVVLAALHDLLTLQADRHPQNLFIDRDGTLTLIDNVQSWQFTWRGAGSDSVFLPGTQKAEIVRLGASLVGKDREAMLPLRQSPLLLLDYRCYVPGGAINTTYPPPLEACLRRMANMTRGELRRRYRLPSGKVASLLHQRATDMLTKGFEWTLRHGAPQPAPGLRYLWQPPCCSLAVGPGGLLACGHPWAPTPALPQGHPTYGTAWDRAYPDPGTFTGGTVHDPADLPPAAKAAAAAVTAASAAQRAAKALVGR